MDGSNKSDEELISYTNEDDVEMIEKCIIKWYSSRTKEPCYLII